MNKLIPNLRMAFENSSYHDFSLCGSSFTIVFSLNSNNNNALFLISVPFCLGL